jgi:hypothetical protein
VKCRLPWPQMQQHNAPSTYRVEAVAVRLLTHPEVLLRREIGQHELRGEGNRLALVRANPCDAIPHSAKDAEEKEWRCLLDRQLVAPVVAPRLLGVCTPAQPPSTFSVLYSLPHLLSIKGTHRVW